MLLGLVALRDFSGVSPQALFRGAELFVNPFSVRDLLDSFVHFGILFEFAHSSADLNRVLGQMASSRLPFLNVLLHPCVTLVHP